MNVMNNYERQTSLTPKGEVDAERQTSLPLKGEGASSFISGEGGHGFAAQSANTGHYAQLNTYDYLADVPGNNEATDLVEVQFKNTRKATWTTSP